MKSLYETIFDTTADPGEFLIELKPFLKDSKCKMDGYTLTITQFDSDLMPYFSTSITKRKWHNLWPNLPVPDAFQKSFAVRAGFIDALRKCDIDTLINQTDVTLVIEAKGDLDNLTIISDGDVWVVGETWDEGGYMIINLSIEAPHISLLGNNDPTSYKKCKFKGEKIRIQGHEHKKSFPSLDARCVLDTNELSIGRYPRRCGDTRMHIDSEPDGKHIMDFYNKIVLPKKLINGIETVSYEGAINTFIVSPVTVSKKKLSDECVNLLNDDMPWKYILHSWF